MKPELLPASHIGRDRGDAARYSTPTADECEGAIRRSLAWDNPVLWGQGPNGSDPLAPTPVLIDAARALRELQVYLGRCTAYVEIGAEPQYLPQLREEHARLGRALSALDTYAAGAPSP